MLASANRVVVGKVVGAAKVTGRDGEQSEAATVAVSSTLKGSHADRVTFLLHNYKGPYARQWQDEGVPLLFCLVKNDGVRVPVPREEFAWILRDDGNDHDAVLLAGSKHRWTGTIPVLTRDFQVLTEREAILTYAAQAIAAMAEDPPRVRTRLMCRRTRRSSRSCIR